MATQELLVETLKQLNPDDFDEFKSLIEAEEASPLISRERLKTANTQDVVALMTQTYGRTCVEVAREALMKMSRTDLVQSLSSTDSGTKGELHVDELPPSLFQTEVKKMESDMELLMETLADLRRPDLEKFKMKLRQIRPHQHYLEFQMLETADQQDLVVLMVETLGSQPVEEIMEILMEIKRENLVEKLSDRSSTLKKKHLPEHLSPLIHKVATKVVVREQLLKTLKGVEDDQNFIWFLKWVFFKNGIPQTALKEIYMRTFLRGISSETLVDQLMEKCGLRCLEMIKEVFVNMNRSDLVKMLETSSGSEEQQSGVELWPALIHKVKTMESVMELLLEKMSDLRNQDLQTLKQLIFTMKRSRVYSMFSPMMMETNLQNLVFSIVMMFGQQSVEKIMEALKEMNKTDLVQRLSESSPEPEKKLSVDDQRSALIHKVAVMAAVKQLLLETLKDLKDDELEEFKKFLQSQVLVFKMKSFLELWRAGVSRTEILDRMVEETGLQSVEATREFLLHINRTDLVQKLPETSSAPKKKAAQLERVSSLKMILLEMLKKLRLNEFYKFRRLLQFTCFQKSLPQLHLTLSDINPSRRSITTLKHELVDQMVEVLGLQCLEVTREVFMDMNRTDLVKKLSDSSSASEETSRSLKSEGCGSVEEVKKMESDMELLMETLADLRRPDLEKFKMKLCQIRPHQHYLEFQMLETADQQDLVVLMVETLGSQPVEEIMEILMEIKREDLVEKLSDRSSTLKKKHLLEHLSPLIHKVATKVVVRERLLKTLKGVEDYQNFIWFLKWVFFKNGIPQFLLRGISSETLVDQLMEKCGLRCLEEIREVFVNMNRSDLVKMLETSSGSEEQQSGVELWPALIHKVKTMESVMELLLEKMSDLRNQDLQTLKQLIFTMKRSRVYSMFSPMMMETNLQNLVFSIVMMFGQQSVEKIMEALKEMNKTDLVQRLSESSPEPEKKLSVDDQRSALIHKVAVMAAVKQLLLETLKDLKDDELEEFKKFLQSQVLVFKRKPSSELWSSGVSRTEMMDEILDRMVEETGLQSVEATRKFLLHINRTDLVQKLPETSSAPKKKAAQLERVSSLKMILLETLDNLSQNEFYKFRWLLQFTCFQKSLPQHHLTLSDINPSRRSITTLKHELVNQMVEVLGLQCLEVTREVFMDMNRTDLVKKLSDSSSASEETSRSLKSEGCGSVEQQESSSWTKLEPEVNRTNTGEATTYKLRSGPGHFECNVSGLRWFCQQKSILKYQFCSWGAHIDRMEGRQYMPAGPLMDVTVIAGMLSEVYLPHWICIEDDPKILDKFAVLHINDDGDIVEKVSEVTATHVRLPDPTFSAKGVLMKVGFPVKYKCKMLIYKTDKAFLTLDVYLIPDDPALVEDMQQKEASYGYKAIRKPDPESLKMGNRFILTTDSDGSEITPERGRKLKYPRGEPDFFEMYIKKPERDFKLILNPKKVSEPVWDCTIREADYQNCPPAAASSSRATSITSMADVSAALEEAAGVNMMVERRRCEEENFVDKHREELIQRVSNIGPILDALLETNVIQQESYDKIRRLSVPQEQMRELYSGPLKAGKNSKAIFNCILQSKEPWLIRDLEGKK